MKIKLYFMITGYLRGHEIIFINDQWLWKDTLESIEIERPCKKCNKMPMDIDCLRLIHCLNGL